MTKNINKFLITIILSLTPVLSFSDISDKSLNEVLKLSGLTAQVNQFPDLVSLGLKQAHQQGAAIPEAEFNAMLVAANETILPAIIIAGVKASIRNSISENEVRELLVWYRSKLGREITRAEEQASTPEGYQLMLKSAESLFKDRERIKFAQRLDALLGSTDMTMGIQEYSGLAVFSAISTAMRPNKPLNLTPFKMQMKASEKQTRAAMEQLVILTFLYSYKSLDTKKLNKYEAFLNKPGTIKFNKVILNSINREFELLISEFANAVGQIYKNNNQEQTTISPTANAAK